MNKVILVGRLTRDPEVRYTQTGKMVATFTLAVNRIVAPGAHPEADFISIVAWGKIAEIIGDSVTKGNRLLVDGRLQIRNYDGKDGQKHWVTEVIAHSVEFLERKKKDEDKSADKDTDGADQFGQEAAPDEIPF